MYVSQKCQYGLRALFELASRHGECWVKISEVAARQAIPPRFLEVILSQLKQAGFVLSRRGSEGGYTLARAPDEITVGEVMRFLQGPIGPVECIGEKPDRKCPLYGRCAFLSLWERVERAVSDVYDNTTFQDLVEEYRQKSSEYVASYSI